MPEKDLLGPFISYWGILDNDGIIMIYIYNDIDISLTNTGVGGLEHDFYDFP